MNITRPGLETFQREVEESSASLYLKTGKDYEQQRKLRPLPWVHEGNVLDMIWYKEGWHDVTEKDEKTGKKVTASKSIRFPSGTEEYPDGIEWTMSKPYNKGDSPQPQTPKLFIAMLVWDSKTSMIKVAPFYQKDVVGYINERLNAKNKDGSDNEVYVPNFTEVDLVIRRINDKKWDLSIKEKEPELPEAAEKALKRFRWSWDLFLRGEDPTGEGSIDFADWMHLMDSNTPAPAANKTVSQAKEPVKETPKEELTGDFDWRKVKTPAGKEVGVYDLENLGKFKDALDKSDKTDKNSDVYKAVLAGIAELSEPAATEPEPEVEAW